MTKAPLIDLEFIVATANTHFGDMIRIDGGLGPLKQQAPDVLLLQEVINDAGEVTRQLRKPVTYLSI